MSKEIKDYLHLYLGCEVQYKDGMRLILKGVLLDRCRIGAKDDDCHFNVPIENFQLILRPLSDMSEEEKKEMVEQKHKYDTGNPESNALTDFAYRLHWLLSKHFDLFNLIPEGLAVDATTLKQQNNNNE